MDYLNRITDFDEAVFQVLKEKQSRTTDLYLSYCRLECCKHDSSYHSPPSSDFLIYFIVKGKGFFKLGPSTYHLEEGQAFFIPPMSPDHSYTTDPDHPWTYTCIGFNGEQALSYLRLTGLSADTPIRDISSIEDIYHVMINILNTKSLTISNEIRRNGYLYKLFSILIAAYQSSQPGSASHEYPAQTYAIYAKNYIDDNYGHTNIYDIANMIGIDRSYLHSVFKKNFQISPQEYLMQCRMEHAAKQLCTTAYPISQIALEIGYEDSLQFSKIFKKYYRLSPSAYRLDAVQKGNQ